ncbi:MAG: tetratricopeptide repeat protein [Chloroflexota bacterium]
MKNIISVSKFRAVLATVILLAGYSAAFSQVYDFDYTYGSRSVERSRALFESGLIRLSEFSLEKALKDFPENPSRDKAALLQSEMDLVSGNYSVALSRLQEFIKTRPNSPLVAYAELSRGFVTFEKADYVRSERFFANASTVAEEDFNARGDSGYKRVAHLGYFWRGISLAHQGKYFDAAPILETAQKKYPRLEYADDALFWLGAIYEVMNKPDSAIVWYGKLGELYPNSEFAAVSKLRLANAHLSLRNAAIALMELERGETLMKRDSSGNKYCPDCEANLLYLKGESYNMLNNYVAALAAFSRLDSLYPRSGQAPYAKLGAAWAHLNLGENDKAVAIYNELLLDEEAVKDKRLNSLAKLYHAVGIKRAGLTENARKELSDLSVSTDFPYQSIALLELGQMHYEAGDYELARRALERGKRESLEANNAARTMLLLGATYMELKSWEKAVNEYKEAEQLALKSSETAMPDRSRYLSEARLKRGMSLVQSLRSAEAISALLGFLAENKNDSRRDEALFWLGEAYYRTDMLKNAVETYKQALEENPVSKRREDLLYSLGWSYFRQKDFPNSSKIFDQMIKEYPKSNYAVEVLTRQGDGYYLQKNYKRAAESYRRAAQVAPGTEEGQYSAYQLSHALYRMGEFEKSITALLDFVKNYPKSSFSPNSIYLIGWIRFQQKRYPEAVDNFEFLINSYPQSGLVARAHYAIGDSYYNMEQYEQAITAYRAVIERFPSSDLAPEAFKSVQYSYMALGKDDEAIAVADNFIQSNPNSPFTEEFKFKKAEMFYTGKRYQDAVAEFDKFTQTHEDSERNPEALYWMGKSYINMNELDQAQKSFNNVIKKYPKSDYAPLALLEWGLMEKSRTEIYRADSIFQRIQKDYPAHEGAAQAGFERAMIKYALGDTVTAIKILRDVADNFPSAEFGEQSLYRVAMYYRATGQSDSARAIFSRLAEGAAEEALAAEAQYRLGESFMRDERWEEALGAFTRTREKFAGVDDWFSLALLNAGEIYEKLDMFAQAAEVYNALASWRPEDDYGKTAKARLKRIKVD